MSWLNNLKISYKIGLIILLLSTVAIGAVAFAAMRMNTIDEAYSATIEHVDVATTMASRSGRRASAYIGNAYKLLSETTAEGNKRAFATVEENRDGYRSLMAKALKKLPEKASLIEPVIA